MRTIRADLTSSVVIEANTDVAGYYCLTIPVTEQVEVAFDVFMPRFGSAAGTLMQGNVPERLTATPGSSNARDFKLRPARYVSGIVVDEHDQPIRSVDVFACMATDRSRGGVALTSTDDDGRFEVFDFPLQKRGALQVLGDEVVGWFHGLRGYDAHDDRGTEYGQIGFHHPSFVATSVADVYALEQEQHEHLRIVMPTGYSVAGRLEDADGKPVPNYLIELTVDNGCRKATLTDDSGYFVLKGLPGGKGNLRSHAMELNQKIEREYEIDRDLVDEVVRLKSIEGTDAPREVELLGMTLATVDAGIQDVYDVSQGVIILAARPETSRLGIGQLQQGDSFYCVGDKSVDNLQHFLEQILAETDRRPAYDGIYRCRIVYEYRRVESIGTNTQYIKLTDEDRQSVRECLAAIQPKNGSDPID